MQEATVKWFNDAKGFGFLEPANGDASVFVFSTFVEGHADIKEGEMLLKEGDSVKFQERPGIRAGSRFATSVVRL